MQETRHQKYELLKRLMEKLDHYEQTLSHEADLDYDTFVAWLAVEAQTQRQTIGEKYGFSVNADVSRLIGMMNRFAKIYMKKAIEPSVLQNIDDFGYLAALMNHGKISKTALIDVNVQEKTTGMEIIKRLVKMGLLLQTEDPNDRRSQLVELSPQGFAVLRGVFVEMAKASDIIAANLTDVEKRVLMTILEKLEVFHRNIVDNERDFDLNNLKNKYLS